MECLNNLLGLRASEIKVISCQKTSKKQKQNTDSDSDDKMRSTPHFIKLYRNKSIQEGEYSDKAVGDYLHDGDEFVFKLTSFDKWIKVITHFKLKSYPSIKFSVSLEMRVVGYFQNSHFFNLVQKMAIDIWNEIIEDKRGVKDLYVLHKLSFKNRKTVKERVYNEDKNTEKLLYAKSPSNRLVEVGKDVKEERAKINITKKNYIELHVDPKKKVDNTFGHDGCLVTTAIFNTVANEAKIHRRKGPQGNNGLVGSVVLDKMDNNQSFQDNK